jgi:hypothetical protein
MEINIEINFNWYHWLLVVVLIVSGLLRALPMEDPATMFGAILGSIVGAFFWVGLGVLVWNNLTG